MKILITGGAGFIGSALIRYLMQYTEHCVVNIDNLTYASCLSSLDGYTDPSRYLFVQANITEQKVLQKIFKNFEPDAVMHLAAESHVDRSIEDSSIFIKTNIVGTYSLLETALSYWKELSDRKKSLFRFHHISTDEVYGSLGSEGLFNENSPYKPNSPYAASKASADHLVRAWHQTYGLPVLITNCSNNYGPYQFPEKLIPLMIIKGLKNKPMPIYGNGQQIRDWLYVEDHVRALLLVLSQGEVGNVYTIGSHAEQSNIDVVTKICNHLDELIPKKTSYRQLITHVADRPGHDIRYAMDSSKLRRDLGWEPVENFDTGLKKTVVWYIHHMANNPIFGDLVA